MAELPQARHLWLISTGTGIGPFLSILKTGAPWQRFERVVLVHAVRTMAELNYQDTIKQVAAAYPLQFCYVPFISREPSDFALAGRVPQAIADGRLETRAGIMFDAAESQVMLCGNPQMVEDTMNTLVGARPEKAPQEGARPNQRGKLLVGHLANFRNTYGCLEIKHMPRYLT